MRPRSQKAASKKPCQIEPTIQNFKKVKNIFFQQISLICNNTINQLIFFHLFSFEFSLIYHNQLYHISFSQILKVESYRGTCILEGLRTSKLADALKEEAEKGMDNVVEFTIVRLLVSIDWVILFTLNKGIDPTAKSGNSLENPIYMFN